MVVNDDGHISRGKIWECEGEKKKGTYLLALCLYVIF